MTLVTAEGDMVHNLHKDIFYIPDPSLSFVGTPHHIVTFSCFEFQAMTVARVYAKAAELPSEDEMRKEYNQRVKKKGLGRNFHSSRGMGEEEEYVKDLVAWINEGAKETGADRVEGHTEEFLEAKGQLQEKLKFLVNQPRGVVQENIDAIEQRWLCAEQIQVR